MRIVLIVTGGILGIGALFLSLFLGHLGMFRALVVEEKEMGPYHHVYESFVGPYAETGKVFDRVYQALKARGIDTVLGLGVYYDNPAHVAKDQLRSDCGVALQTQDAALLESLKTDFKVQVLAQSFSIVTAFPVKNGVSYMLGPMKAYPALNRYSEKRHYKIVKTYELYDEPNKRILFVANVEK